MNDQYPKWLDQLEVFCAYRERTKMDVLSKMSRLKIPHEFHPSLTTSLIENGFLDEERYIHSFVRAKIHIKRDGLQKIRFVLRSKQLPSELIDNILLEYSSDVYDENIDALMLKKWNALKIKNTPQVSKEKLIRYLMGKGYIYSEFGDKLKHLK